MIPKIIHYCWFGDKPKPESVQKCINSWKKYCRGYKIIEWNESNYDIHKNKYMEQAYQAKKWGFVPDFARLDIVFRYGGIYLDTDVQIVKKIDSLLQFDSFFGFESIPPKTFVNLGHGFGAISNHPIISALLDSYNELSFLNSDGSLNLIPSPELNSIVFEKLGFIINNETQKIKKDIVFSSEYFAPKSFLTGMIKKTKQTYSIHHYDASWYDKKQQVEKLQRWERYKKDRFKRRMNKVKGGIRNFLLKTIEKKNYNMLMSKLRSKQRN